MSSKQVKKKININYKDAGVNTEAGHQLIKIIKPEVEKTRRAEILSGIGSFAALSALPKHIKNPVLVTCTDGVGTKIEIAKELEKYETIGIDLVAMCVNDLITCGAEPLLFLDYYLTDKLNINTASKVIKGIAKGCTISNCSLVGGETAEHPGTFPKKSFDLAGFSLGVVDKNKIIEVGSTKLNDSLIGIASSGLHSNGFSLIRKILHINNISLKKKINGISLGQILLEPTTIYVKSILQLRKEINVSGIAHITGGGFYENVPRILSKDQKAVLNFNIDEWPNRDLFHWINKFTSLENMLSTFNCGVGMIISVSKEDEERTLKILNEKNKSAQWLGTVERKKRNEESIVFV